MTEPLEFKRHPLYKTTLLWQVRTLRARMIRLFRATGLYHPLRRLTLWLNGNLKAAGL